MLTIKRRSLILFPLLCLYAWIFPSACSEKTSPEKLRENIVVELASCEGTFAVAFKNLSTGELVLINEHEVFHAASTMKTPVMIEVFRQAEEGRWKLNDSVEVINTFRSIVDASVYSLQPEDDSEQNLYAQIGKKRTLHELVYDMITVSSNLATNILIEYVGAEKVTRTMRQLGAANIQVLRGVEDGKAYQQGLNNTTTAYDLLIIYEKIATGQAVSQKASEEMIQILLDQRFRDIIPALLPPEVKVAHKTGMITGTHHDSGIVMLPDGRKYILVLLSKHLKDMDAGTTTLAKVSKIIYDYVTATTP
jgi:beta-lactamase class A